MCKTNMKRGTVTLNTFSMYKQRKIQISLYFSIPITYIYRIYLFVEMSQSRMDQDSYSLL